MKKYFMKSSGEELQFGDMIELDLSKEIKNGHISHKHLECKFIPDPEFIDFLISEGVIVAKEVEDESNDEEDENDELLDFNDCPLSVIDDLVESVNALGSKIDNLTSLLSSWIANSVDNVKPQKNAKPAGK